MQIYSGLCGREHFLVQFFNSIIKNRIIFGYFSKYYHGYLLLIESQYVLLSF